MIYLIFNLLLSFTSLIVLILLKLKVKWVLLKYSNSLDKHGFGKFILYLMTIPIVNSVVLIISTCTWLCYKLYLFVSKI